MDFFKIFTALQKGKKLDSSATQKVIATVINSVAGVATLAFPVIGDYVTPETVNTIAEYGALGLATYNSYITLATSDTVGTSIGGKF